MKKRMYKAAHPLRNSYKILFDLLEIGVLHGTVVVLRGLVLLTCVGVACVCSVETAVCTVEALAKVVLNQCMNGREV